MRRVAGASLAGVLVALAIVAIMAAVALPVWRDAVVRMRRAEAQAALRELLQAQERHFTQFNTYLAFGVASGDPAARGWRWWSGSSAASSAYELAGQACEGEPLSDCIALSATPGTANVDPTFRDPQCERLLLTSSGQQRATGPARDCWR